MQKIRSGVRGAGLGALLALSLLVVGGCSSAEPGDPRDAGGGPSAADPGPAPSDSAPSDPEESDGEAEPAALGGTTAAQCVLGSWQIDKSSEMWMLWGGDDDNVELSGDVLIHFTDADFYGIEYDEVVILNTIIDDLDYTVETVWNGLSSGFYEVHDDGRVTTEVVPESTITTTQTTPAGTEISENVVGEPFPLHYTCEGDRMYGFAQEDPASAFVAFDRID